jgi:hypothetical protein
MPIKQIIQESINKNPLGLKEALEEELRGRIALALEAKVAESEHEDDEEEEDEEDDEDEESEQIDEISKKTLASYVKKATPSAMSHGVKGMDYKNDDQSKHFNKAMNRMIGIQRAADKLAK